MQLENYVSVERGVKEKMDKYFTDVKSDNTFISVRDMREGTRTYLTENADDLVTSDERILITRLSPFRIVKAKNFITTDNVYVLKVGNKVRIEYLYEYLKHSDLENHYKAVKGNKQKLLTIESLRNFTVKFGSKDDQDAISIWHNLVAENKKQLEKMVKTQF